ncbi:MAG: hypothetical protein AAB217_18655 [Chloroflexota bacterium]
MLHKTLRAKAQALTPYISLDDAAKLAGLSVAALQAKVKTGKITAIMAKKIAPKNSNEPTLADRQAYIDKHFAHLKGKGIGMSDAQEKYGIWHQMISEWVKRGYIKRIGVDHNDKRKVLVDEADVAYCAEVRKFNKGKPNRWLFDSKGALYVPKGETAEVVEAI